MANTEAVTKGAEVLNRLMASLGFSPADVAARTNGEVSESSVRAYRSGEYAPRPSSAIQVAQVFGVEDGAELLKAWDMPEAAEGWSARPTAYHLTSIHGPAVKPRAETRSDFEVSSGDGRWWTLEAKTHKATSNRPQHAVFLTTDGFGIVEGSRSLDDFSALHTSDEENEDLHHITYRGIPIEPRALLAILRIIEAFQAEARLSSWKRKTEEGTPEEAEAAERSNLPNENG